MCHVRVVNAACLSETAGKWVLMSFGGFLVLGLVVLGPVLQTARPRIEAAPATFQQGDSMAAHRIFSDIAEPRPLNGEDLRCKAVCLVERTRAVLADPAASPERVLAAKEALESISAELLPTERLRNMHVSLLESLRRRAK